MEEIAVKGETKIMLNDATICQMVSEHINNHVLKERHVCVKVDYEWKDNDKKMFAILIPVEAETQPASQPAEIPIPG